MQDWLTISAHDYPHRIALITTTHTLTYTALNRMASRFARALMQRHEINQGQHVAVLMSASADYVAVIHALMKIGAVLVPLNPRLTPHEITYQLAKGDCAALIHNAGRIADAVSLPCPTISVESLHEHDDDSPLARALNLEDVQAMVFTSGTSGTPKGAMLTYANQFYSATASAFRLGVLPDDRWLCPLPLAHVGGLAIILRSAQYGTGVILHNGFDADAVNQAIDTQGVSLISLVPTMLHRVIAARDSRPFPSTLRLILLGGAAATTALVEQALTLGAPVATTYGLTEACSQVATQTPDLTVQKPGSVGKAVPFAALRIVDEHERDVPTGEYGEVWVNSPTVMQGYYEDAAATRKTVHKGWLRTGDIGYLDDDGDLWLVQRRSDLIVTGGENVYPAEVEAALKAHPAIADACVMGIASDEWGQQVAAAIVPRDATTLDTDALTESLRDTLAGYKLPRRWLILDSLPLTASGKVARAAVADLFAAQG